MPSATGMVPRWRIRNAFDFRKILAHDRNEIRIDYGRRCTLKFAIFGEYFVRNGNWKTGMVQGPNHELFVSRVRKREEQTKGNGICAAVRTARTILVISAGDTEIRSVRQRPSFPAGPASLARDERFGLLKQQIVKLRPCLSADFQNVFESGRGNQRDLAAGSLKQRVRTHGSAANEL